MYLRMVACFCCALHQFCFEIQKAGRREYTSPTFSSQHLENLLSHTYCILLGNMRIHVQMLLLNLVIPGTGMLLPFPNPFVGNFVGKKQNDVSPQAMQTLTDQEPVSQRLKLRPLSKGAWNWVCPTERRPINCADCESSKENISHDIVRILGAPADPQTCANLLLLMQCPELSLRKTKRPGCDR